jgi:hypothetical protein
MALTAGFRNRITLEGGEEVTRGFAAVGRAGEQAFGNVRTAVEGSARGFLTLRGHLDAIPGSFSAVARAGTSLKAAVAGIFAFEGLNRAREAFSSVTESMSQLRNTAAGTGFATDAVAAFKSAVEQTGVIGEKVGPALVQFSGALGQARTSSTDLRNSLFPTVNVLKGTEGAANVASQGITTMHGALSDAATQAGQLVKVFEGGLEKGISDTSTPFKVLGINIEAFAKNASGMEQLLDAVAKGFVRLKQTDPGSAVRAAALLFGEDDITKFGTALDRIAAVGLPAFKKEAQELGRVPSPEEFNRLLDYESAWANLRGTIEAALRPVITAILPALTSLLKGTTDSVQALRDAFVKAGIGDALSQWAQDVRVDLQPALADIATLIKRTFKPDDIQPIRTDFVRGLVDAFASARDVINTVIAAFKVFIGVVDAALAPINAIFGTRFRGDVLLGVAALLKIVGGFAAIEAAVGLAKAALLAFTVIARLSPFGLLAAAVALFVAKVTEGSDVAKKFWDGVNGGTSEAAQALGDTATSAANFGTAASEAEKSVARALGTTERLGDAAQTTGARFVTMADAVPKASDGLPAVLRGIQQVGGAAEQVKAKFVDVTAQTAAFRKETEAAAKAATAAPALQKALTPQAAPEAGATTSVSSTSFAPPVQEISAWQAFKRDLDDILTSIHQDTQRREGQFVDDETFSQGLARWKAQFSDFFSGIGKNAVDQAQLDNLFPQTLPVTEGWTTQLANWAKDAAARVGEVFTQLPAAGDPAFLGSWGLAVDKFSTDSSGKIRDQFSQLDVPAQPGFLATWGTAITSWLTGQVNEIKSAFSGVSLPSLVSTAQAAPVTTDATAGGLGTTDTGTVGIVDSASQAIDRARTQLTDLASSVSTAIADGVTQISDLIANSGAQLQDFFDLQTKALSDLVQTTLDSLSTVVDNAITVIGDGIQSAFDSLQSSADTVFGFISTQMDTVNGLLSTLADTISSIVSAIGGAASSVAGLIPGFAGGGHIRGPGGDTGDKIPAWLSNFEFVNRAQSVRYYGVDLFHALNRMAIPRDLLRQMLAGMQGFSLGGLVGGLSIPVVPRYAPALAGGGLVTVPVPTAPAAAQSRPITLVLDNVAHPVLAADDVAESLLRTGRRLKMLRA